MAPALKSFSSGTSAQEQRADGMSTLPHASSLLFTPQRARKGHGQNLCCTRTWRKAHPGSAEVRPASGTHTQVVRPGGQHQDPLSSGQPPGLTATRGVQLETQGSTWCLSLAGELGHTHTHRARPATGTERALYWNRRSHIHTSGLAPSLPQWLADKEERAGLDMPLSGGGPRWPAAAGGFLDLPIPHP